MMTVCHDPRSFGALPTLHFQRRLNRYGGEQIIAPEYIWQSLGKSGQPQCVMCAVRKLDPGSVRSSHTAPCRDAVWHPGSAALRRFIPPCLSRKPLIRAGHLRRLLKRRPVFLVPPLSAKKEAAHPPVRSTESPRHVFTSPLGQRSSSRPMAAIPDRLDLTQAR